MFIFMLIVMCVLLIESALLHWWLRKLDNVVRNNSENLNKNFQEIGKEFDKLNEIVDK